MIMIALQVKQHLYVASACLEHQGIVNLAMKNFNGATKSFQRMRDVAEEIRDDREWELRAYMHLGNTL
jgi:hypothetical protein